MFLGTDGFTQSFVFSSKVVLVNNTANFEQMIFGCLFQFCRDLWALITVINPFKVELSATHVLLISKIFLLET